jgi:VCBS repeat-containing protein
MAMGDSVRLDQVVSVSDGAGGTAEQRVRITVNGSNDPPVFTQVDLAGSVSEDGTLGAAGRISVIDVDRGAMVTVFTDTNPNYGTLLVTSSDWRYTLDNTKAQALGEGETATEALRLVTMDQYGFGETRTLAIEVHGRNDAPRFVADTVATQIPENQIIAPRLWATDADANDHVLTSIVGGPDAALFRIGDDTNLYFVTAPDWEHPSDADHNNIYQVVLQATDDHGAWAQLAIGLQVVNVDESLAALVGVPGPDGAW